VRTGDANQIGPSNIVPGSLSYLIWREALISRGIREPMDRPGCASGCCPCERPARSRDFGRADRSAGENFGFEPEPNQWGNLRRCQFHKRYQLAEQISGRLAYIRVTLTPPLART
jgi:hypothetical protein